ARELRRSRPARGRAWQARLWKQCTCGVSPYLSCGTALRPIEACAPLNRCAYATGNARAVVLVFLTIVNVLYSNAITCYLRAPNNLAHAADRTVTIFDAGTVSARQHRPP